MKKDELWAAYVEKNPQFEGDGTVTMTKAGLRKFFLQTWEHAHDQGVKNGRAIEDLKKRVEGVLDKFWKMPPN